MLDVGCDGAPRDEQPLGYLAICEPFGYEAHHLHFSGGKAVPSESGAPLYSPGPRDPERALRRLDTGDVPNGAEPFVAVDRLAQQRDRLVCSGGVPKSDPASPHARPAGRGESASVGGDSFEEGVGVVGEQTAQQRSARPRAVGVGLR